MLESPLEAGNHIPVTELNRIKLGVLNYYDLIISKLFRGDTVDQTDCLSLIRAKQEEISIEHLRRRYHETARYDIFESKVNKNLEDFCAILEREGLIP